MEREGGIREYKHRHRGDLRVEAETAAALWTGIAF